MSDRDRDDAFQYATAANPYSLGVQRSCLTEAENMALMQTPGAIYRVPDWQACQMRLNCLQMALYAPDGAQPPPLAEVIERAQAYWKFIHGEDRAE